MHITAASSSTTIATSAPEYGRANDTAVPTDLCKGHVVTTRHDVQVGRPYDPRAEGDGARVLVDRIWPRGLSKEKADLDEWCRQVAPSTELRTWYGHDPERFKEFTTRYRIELQEPERAQMLKHLGELARHRPLTLLTASKRSDISEAAVLVELILAAD